MKSESFSSDFASFVELKFVVVVVLSFLVVYAVWILFFRPYNAFWDWTDIGFDDAGGKSDSRKRARINEMRRKKKMGEYAPPPFPNGWFAILESDDLPISTMKPVDVLGKNFVAWRGNSGRSFVADAYCPHLGAHLGVGGSVKRDCIVCPFHGWTFDGNGGKLKKIPYSDSIPEFGNLKMWTTMEAHGFIFIWHHAHGSEPTWWPDVKEEVESKRWRYRGRTEFRVACHIQEIPENGPDAAHLNVVHTAPVTSGTCPDQNKFQWNLFEHLWSASWQPNSEPRQHEAVLSVYHELRVFGRFSCVKVNVDVRQLGPGIVHMHFDTIFGKGIMVQTVTPLEPLLQKVVHRFYSSPGLIHPLSLLMLHGEAVQVSRDVRIWNRKTFLRHPLLVREDKSIKAFRRWFAQFYSLDTGFKHIVDHKCLEF